MSARFVATGVVAIFLSVGASLAQSIEEVGGPSELPPPSFRGQQYVDSRGCTFVRAGVDGRVNWVPRIDRSREVICDRPPTFAPRPVAAAEPEPAPAPVAATPAPAPAPVAAAPRNPGPPMETIASAMVPEAPVRRAAPAVTAAPPPVVSAQAGSTGRKIACFENTPVPVRVRLTNGGTAVLCTRGDGTLEGARAPIYPPGSGVAPSLDLPEERAAPAPRTVVRTAEAPEIAPPPGYRVAWEDDRLNPQRGQGTAEGQAQQDRVWTRDVPAVAAAEAPAQPRLSTSSAAGLYVQVGSFGVPGNAVKARETLRALGLPTARAEQGGLTIVLAGPFTSENEARMAQRAARGAGFGDAFIR